jgi:hypothetical protein
VSLEARRPAQDRPSPDNPAATTQAVASSLPGYVVLMITKYGMPRRKVYLDLGHARTAVQRAHAKGQPARLVLCTLQPVVADLDGGWSE